MIPPLIGFYGVDQAPRGNRGKRGNDELNSGEFVFTIHEDFGMAVDPCNGSNANHIASKNKNFQPSKELQ